MIFVGCDGNQISKSITLNTFTKDYYSGLSKQNTKIINVSNSKGGVIITGWPFSDSLRLYLYKTIDASSKELAEAHFDDIHHTISITEDTLNVTIVSPIFDLDEVSYKHCTLSIRIPYKMNCKIKNSNGAIFVDQLSSNLFIEGSKNKIQIDRHIGSCEINSSNDIDAHVTLSDSGYCKLFTVKGNISLGIPDWTNAKANLRTEEGTITYSNLIFNELNQNDNCLSGILGTGGAEITIYTKKGDIEIIGIK